MYKLKNLFLASVGIILSIIHLDVIAILNFFLQIINELILGMQKAYPAYAEILPPLIAISLSFIIIAIFYKTNT